MAVCESRRSGEKWFELMERTTHPHALMHVIGGNRDCCRDNDVNAVASTLAHSISDFSGKGHL